MSPVQAKQKQHERYEAVAVQVLRGRAGYKPAVKSRFSKSASRSYYRFCLILNFEAQ